MKIIGKKIEFSPFEIKQFELSMREAVKKYNITDIGKIYEITVRTDRGYGFDFKVGKQVCIK